MPEAIYDQHAEFYLDFVEQKLAEGEDGFFHMHVARLRALLGDRLCNARVCDIGCGEGYLGRALIQHGVREVIGIDLSQKLIDTALARRNSARLIYQVDDAHELQSIAGGSVDIAISQMALMDIADHAAMFGAVRRILRPQGVFAFSILHPCFGGSPFRIPDQPPFVKDENGEPSAYLIRRYATEGYWHSGGTGVRGHVGAYHRTLATYINDLIRSGFSLEYLEEPLTAKTGLNAEIPLTLIVIGVLR